MNVLIVEDEMIISEMMKVMLEELNYKVVGQARDYEEAETLMTNEAPDMIMLDINLGKGKTGIDFAAMVNDTSQIPFIFVTSNSDAVTVQLAKAQFPYGFLNKPFTKTDLYTSIEVAMHSFDRLGHTQQSNVIERDFLFVKDGSLFVKIKFEDILFIKSEGNYIQIQTASKKRLIRSSMKDFTEKLKDRPFSFCHRSYIVNLNKIDSIGANFLKIGEQEIPLSKLYKDELLNLFMN